MARLQIFTLPPWQQAERPFALILDRCDPDALVGADWQRFAEECGARSFMATDQEITLDGEPSEVEIPEDVMAEIAVMIRDHVQAAVDEAAAVRPQVVQQLDNMGLLPKGEKPPRSVWGAGAKPDPREQIPGWMPPSGEVTQAVDTAIGEAAGRG